MTSRKKTSVPATDAAETKTVPFDVTNLPDSSIGRYSSGDIAQDLSVDASAVRRRRTPWVEKVIGADRTRVNGRYTELAKVLFLDFDRRVSLNREISNHAWVQEMTTLVKAAESSPVASDDVIDVEFADDIEPPHHREVGGSLAQLKALSVVTSGHAGKDEQRAATAEERLAALMGSLTVLASESKVASTDGHDQNLEARIAEASLKAAEEEVMVVQAERDARAKVRAAVGE